MIRAIQGLRAIAIMQVLLFHLSVPGFSNGYLGVDLFFSISGFVITYAWWTRINNTTNLRKFYVHRFWRLFPSACVVVVLTTSTAAIVLLPTDARVTFTDATYAIGQIVNLYYLLTTNYFSADTDYRLLTHYWSLAVEEQFYLGFGLIALFVGTKLSHRALMIFLGSAFVISIGFSQWSQGFHAPLNFFSPVSRIWQFLFGVIAAKLVTIHSQDSIPVKNNLVYFMNFKDKEKMDSILCK